jgi:uncharacterized protein YqeY
MSILEQIETDFSVAQKNREMNSLATLRLLKASIQNLRIAKQRDLDDNDLLALLRSEIKKRQESIEGFTAGNRPEQAAQEAGEMALLKKYLPVEMSDEELRATVMAALENVSEEQKKNFGVVMGLAVKAVGTGADGRRISGMVKSILAL